MYKFLAIKNTKFLIIKDCKFLKPTQYIIIKYIDKNVEFIDKIFIIRLIVLEIINLYFSPLVFSRHSILISRTRNKSRCTDWKILANPTIDIRLWR